MKQLFRFFTLLLVAVVTSSSAWAIDVPKPKATALTPDVEVYILNVGTQKYVGQGEGWGTQSCVSDKALKYILKTKRDDGNAIGQDENYEDFYELPAGQYFLYSPDISGAAGHSIDRWDDADRVGAGIKCCFSDQTDFDSRGRWQIASVGNNTYTLQVPQGLADYTEQQNQYVEGEFLGVQLDHESNAAVDGVTYGLYHDVVYTTNPENCQFQFILAADYEIYKAKTEIAALIDDIKAKGLAINTAEAEAIVANENATLEEVTAALTALKDEVANLASRHNPADVSEKYLVNPFVGTSESIDGWTSSGGSPSYQANLWEFWSVSGAPTFSQTTKELPKGIYSLTVEGYTRTDMVATFEFGDQKMNLATVSSSEVNDRTAGRNWINAGNGQNTLFLFLDEPKAVPVRITADNTTGDHWTVWGDFRMTFYGSADDDYKILADLYTANWEKDIEGRYYYAPYVDALKEVLAKSEAATTKDEVLAIYEEVKAAYDALFKSADLYDYLFKYVDETVEGYDDPEMDEKFNYYDPFIDIWKKCNDMWYDEDTSLNNEELQALIDEYERLRAEALISVMPDPGTDISHLLVNAQFRADDDSSSFDGWTVASRQSDADTGNPFQNNAGKRFVVEQWNGGSDGAIIDVYQTLRLPWRGAYRIKTKGWYRSTTSQSAHDSDPALNKVNTYLYGSSSKYFMHDIYEFGYDADEWANGPGSNTIDGQTGSSFAGSDGLNYPNNCAAANWLFTNTDNYDMQADFLIVGDEVKVGMYGDNIPAGGWLIWSDFALEFLGNDIEVMQPIAETTADQYRDLLNEPMAATTKAALQAAIDAIDNPESQDALLDAYKNIGPASDAALKSIDLYIELDKAIAELNNTMIEEAETTTAEALEAAEALADEMAIAYEDGTIDDEDIPAALERIQKAISALHMPDVTLASDENPIDMTKLIINPKYSNGTAATLSGWTNTDNKSTAEFENADYGYAEGWNTSFDLYQDLEGMPEGTYHVIVNGLYRQAGTETDAKIWRYGYAEQKGALDLLDEASKTDVPEYIARGKFYANGDSLAFKPWIFIGTDEWTVDAQEEFSYGSDGSWTELTDSITDPTYPQYYYFPNNRLALYTRAQAGFYENEIYCYVAADGKLRIGACNKEAEDNDWVPFSNWRLYYLGTESVHESATGIRETETNTGAIEAVYSIDGRRQQGLQKGLNIVVRNGKAQKIMVK